MREGINLRCAALAALAALAAAAPGSGQRLLDLPIRTGAGVDALAGGPIAVFWNPGALGVPGGRGEALIVDVRGPSATGLDGIALAAVLRLDDRTAIGLGYRHSGIGDIEETSESPLAQDGATPLEIGEDVLHFGAVRSLGPALSVGATAHYLRGAAVVGSEDVIAIGAGFRYASESGEGPTLGASIQFDEAGADWSAGAGYHHGVDAGRSVLGLELGLGGSARVNGITPRAATGVTVRSRLRVSAGVVGEPEFEGRAWSPALGASLFLGRYVVGILREQLPNGIGAIHSLRFGLSF